MADQQNAEHAALLGQLFVVGLPGTILDDSTRRLIEEFRINNFIYFKRNVGSREQLQQLSEDLCRTCAAVDLAPPLIAIDQEGGTVTRLPPPFTQFPDARVLAESQDPEKELTAYARTCARELSEIGVNYNLAPVLDVCEAGKNFFMEKRSLGGDAESVGRLGSMVLIELQANSIAACGKHFPGLGAAVVDPHISIMTSHTIYKHLDPQYPATLSQKILTGLLRDRLGYEGVIITDDLEMGAIEKEGDLGHAALQAFKAGADLLLICHSHEKAIDALEKTGRAVHASMELQARVRESTDRVSVLRERFAGQPH
jgi:beta-N-acetylhexosaminidase